MPQQEQTIIVNELDKETILAISYSAFKQLGWDIPFAGEDKLLALTPKSWKTNAIQLIATGAPQQLTINSEMTQGESFDMGGKNKKNIAAFLTAFDNCKNSISESVIGQNLALIDALRIKTIEVAEQETKDAAAIDAAMNLSTGNLYVTYTTIAINVLVFILMAVNGAGIFEPDGLVHINWGSNYTPLTLSGDWWRLVTNVFIHFGIIHLLMNMYCLYMVGIYLEPMLGKAKCITAYLCTGILASLVSLWWHSDGVNSAGASGAIFGMDGLFLALLTTNLIPKQMRLALLQSIGIFVVYNLIYGMKGGVDNAAHIGGLISGFVIGYIYVLAIKKEKEGQKLQWVIPVVIGITVAVVYGYLQQNKTGKENRENALTEVKDASYKDNDKFIEKYNAFVELQDKALAVVYDDSTVTGEFYKSQLDEAALPKWEKALVLANEMKSLKVSEKRLQKAANVIAYIELRKQEITLRKEMATDSSPSVINRSNELVKKINSILETLQ